MNGVPGRKRTTVATAALGFGVTVAYVAAAHLGFRLAFIAEQVTTAWAPTGIAEAALLLWGTRLWPAVWIGAFLANATTDAPIWTAAGVATGNTLEAIAAALILRRIGFDPAFGRIRDAVAFIVVAAVAAPAISASIGVTMLSAGQVQPWTMFVPLWTDWFIGDALGALVVAPVLLTLLRTPLRSTARQRVETAILIVSMLILTNIVFGATLTTGIGPHPLEFVVFPLIIAAAVRLRQPATSLVVLTASAVSIWHTAQGSGPFQSQSVHQSLILLQVFMGVLAGSGLVLAAAIAERQTAERRRAAAHAVGQVLANASSVDEAAPGILAAVCSNLDGRVGALWTIDRDLVQLRPVSVWTSGEGAAAFTTAMQESAFARGIGLPGRVWASGEPAWIEDLSRDDIFPRGPMARQSGLHSAFGFPIRFGGDVLGVVECFRRTAAAPDADLLATIAIVGDQIGQFVVRTRVEAAGRQSESRTRAIVETALDAIITMNHRGAIVEFNSAAERIFGHSRSEVIGRELAALIIPPRLQGDHRSGLSRYLSTGEGPFIDRRFETTAVHADGREFPVEVSITAVATEGPPLFTGFVRDVTDRARAEAERRDLLERERLARRDAEAANRAKDEFLATLSHELRTPLTAIVGWARMLVNGTVEEQNVQRALEVIDRNAQAQVQLVADLIDVSRIITGGLTLAVEPVDLKAILESSLDVVHPAAEAKQITIRLTLPVSPVLLDGDAARLQQIVWNLLSNAVKFTPQSGHVEIDLEDSAVRVRIRVADDGPGIPEDFLPHVFTRFSQADGSSTRTHGGLGLGLAIVKHLSEAHGGSVGVHNQRSGSGAVFTVELPRLLGADRKSPDAPA